MKITVESSVASLGHYATASNLRAMGWTPRQIEAAVKRGTLAWKRDGGLETTALYDKTTSRPASPVPSRGRKLHSSISHIIQGHAHARKKIDPHEVKQRLEAAGIDFRDDFHTLSSSAKDLILAAARAAAYRKRKDAPGSTARM